MRNHRPKHVELIGIINKLLLLHLVGCKYYSISDSRSDKHQIHNHLFASFAQIKKKFYVSVMIRYDACNQNVMHEVSNNRTMSGATE